MSSKLSDYLVLRKSDELEEQTARLDYPVLPE